jgi:hypothetical protein
MSARYVLNYFKKHICKAKEGAQSLGKLKLDDINALLGRARLLALFRKLDLGDSYFQNRSLD